MLYSLKIYCVLKNINFNFVFLNSRLRKTLKEYEHCILLLLDFLVSMAEFGGKYDVIVITFVI